MPERDHMERYVIIVAGGKGLRMGSEVPKQFLEVAGRPVLMRTLDRFLQFDPQVRIVLVLPEDQIPFWEALCQKHDFHVPHKVVPGGASRFESVRCGLSIVPDGCLVAVHDGVRPFVSLEVIARCFDKALEAGSAVPVIPVQESVRRVEGSLSRHMDRTFLRLVQTPQVFDATLLKEAYKRPYEETFTDDASVFEAAGREIQLVEGNRENIKLTTPFDLKLSECLL